MPTQNPFEHPLKQLQAAVDTAKPVILQKMGTIAVNFVHENFEKQGFQGATFEPWDKRKKETKRSRGKHVLTDTAALRNATRFSIVNDGVVLQNALPYAQIHNEGGTIQKPERQGIMSFRRSRGKLKLGKIQTPNQRKQIVAQNKHTIKAHEVKMKQRKFIGDSPVLHKRIEPMIAKEIANHIKK